MSKNCWPLGTSESDFIWKQGLCKHKQARKDLDELMLDGALHPITGLFIRKKEDTEKPQRHREAEIPAMQPQVKER